MYLRFVKMVEGSKLYNTLILRQFNEINPKDCNMGNLLTELVIKVQAKFQETLFISVILTIMVYLFLRMMAS